MAAITRKPILDPDARRPALRLIRRQTSGPAPEPLASRPSISPPQGEGSGSGSRFQQRLGPLDAGLYALESRRSPMHLGWAAVFSVPTTGARPSFEAIRGHIESRLGRAPRYRQRLLEVPLGLARPVWVDDENFDITRHVHRALSSDLGELVDGVMSTPLDLDRPLWELWIAERLDDGHVGVVGKAHHALVDGLAAVELMALLLDPTPEPHREVPETWRPEATPTSSELVTDALRDGAAGMLAAGRRAVNFVRDSRRVPDLARHARSRVGAVAHAALPIAPRSPLNGKTASTRHLAWSSQPLKDLEVIARRFGTTINDIVLAVSAGALRELALGRDEVPARLKAMVPVSVRAPDERWGNRIAFLFPGLPCDEPDAVRRLCEVHAAMCTRKRLHEAETADVVLRTLGRSPRPLRNLASRVLTSPRLSNVTISNVPGPPVPLYMMGCQADRAYPVVPLTARHGISIGITSVNGSACFGVYADGTRAEDADRLAEAVVEGIDELLTRCSEASSAGTGACSRTPCCGRSYRRTEAENTFSQERAGRCKETTVEER